MIEIIRDVTRGRVSFHVRTRSLLTSLIISIILGLEWIYVQPNKPLLGIQYKYARLEVSSMKLNVLVGNSGKKNAGSEMVRYGLVLSQRTNSA